MKKLVFLLFFICLVSKVNAQNESFEQPQDVLGQADVIKMPDCDNKNFEAKIIEAAKTYFQNQPALSTVAKRKQILRLQGLQDFEVASSEDFSPETDFNTANALIMIKINEHIEQKDILLCKQKGHIKNAVYVIAYPYMDNVKVHLINLSEKDPDYHAVSFIYP